MNFALRKKKEVIDLPSVEGEILESPQDSPTPPIKNSSSIKSSSSSLNLNSSQNGRRSPSPTPTNGSGSGHSSLNSSSSFINNIDSPQTKGLSILGATPLDIEFDPFLDDFKDYGNVDREVWEATLQAIGNPKSKDIVQLCRCGSLYHKLGLLEVAYQFYELAFLAVSTKENSDFLFYSLAIISRQLQQYNQALEWINKISSNSIQFTALKILIQAYLENNNNNWAPNHTYPTMKELNEKSFFEKNRWHYFYGELLFAQKNYKEAIDQFSLVDCKDSILLYSGRPLALRAMSHFYLQNLEKALEDISIVLSTYPFGEYRLFLKNMLEKAIVDRDLMIHKYYDYFLERGIRSLNTFVSSDSNFKLTTSIIFHRQASIDVVSKGDLVYSTDSFSITNQNDKSYTFKIEYPQSKKYDLIIIPNEGNLKKGIQTNFECKLRIFCTTHLRLFIKVHISPKHQIPRGESVTTLVSKTSFLTSRVKRNSDENFVFYVLVNASSKLSPILDYDEIYFKRLIAEGGFGKVFEGLWRNSIVAVKVFKIPPETQENEGLKRELDIMSKLKHPNIVQFIGATQLPGQTFSILMEFVGGGSLVQLLEKPVDEQFKYKLGLDIAKGMGFLHSNSIYHRDLKSDNVLVISADPGASINLKITDFGTSRTISQAYLTQRENNIFQQQSNPMITKGMVGTLAYACPEIVRGKREYFLDKADVYSFGTVLWEIFTQKRPYDDEPYKSMEYFELVNLIASGKCLPIPPQVPRLAQQIILQCWQDTSELRPPFSKIVRLISGNENSNLSATFGTFPPVSSKVCILGTAATGKTSLIEACLNQRFIEQSNPTEVWWDYNISQTFILRDTPPTESWEKSFLEEMLGWGNGFMILFSVISPFSFNKVKEIYSHILRIHQKVPPIVIVATFADCVRKVDVSQGRELANKLKCPYIEVSAKTFFNLDDSIEVMSRRIQIMHYLHDGIVISQRDILNTIYDVIEQNENLAHEVFNCKFSKALFFETKIIAPREIEEKIYEKETFTITNCSSTEIQYEIKYKPNPKYELIIDHPSGKLKKNEKIDIEFQLRVFCTTKLCQLLALTIFSPKKKDIKPLYYNLGIVIESELGPSLDFNEIQLLEEISKESFGINYRGQWRTSEVAVQMINKTNFSEEEFQVIDKEIKMLRYLSHQYIQQYMGSTHIPTLPLCIISEHIRGIPLSKYLIYNPSLSLAAKYSLIIEISKAITFLHTNNVYFHFFHANKVIITANEPDVLSFKLIGFGISLLSQKILFVDSLPSENSENQTPSSPNASKMRASTIFGDSAFSSPKSKKDVGLPQMEIKKRRPIALEKDQLMFVAPEIFLDSANLSAAALIEKADVYAFGILIWEVCCSQLPHLHPLVRDLDKWEIVDLFNETKKRLPFPPEKNIPLYIQKIAEACWLESFRRPPFSNIRNLLQEQKSP